MSIIRYFSEKKRIFSTNLRQLDRHITSNLNNGGFETRPAKSQGLWCFLLLPTVLIIYSMMYDVSTTYKLAAYSSIGLAVYCLLFTLFLTISCMVLTEAEWGGCLQSGIVGCFVIYFFMGPDIWFSALFTLPTTYLLSYLLRTLLSYPKTFTIGEAMIVSQGLVTLLVVMLASCMFTFTEAPEFVDRINITVLSTVGLIVTALSHLKQEQENLSGLLTVIGIGIIIELFQLVLLGGHCIPTLIFFIFNKKRMELIVTWSLLLLGAILIVFFRTVVKDSPRTTTVTRKAFHLMAAAVFTSGILLDLSLMKLAAGCGFGLIILVEALRKSNIDSVSVPLQAAFDAYSDEKDCGEFAMTPIYMYAGLAAPAWLVPWQAPALDRLAGVLSIGIGDSAASWFGSRYGSVKWPGGNRTLEGTAFNVLSQIMFVYTLIIFGFLEDGVNALPRTALVGAVNALVEAQTDQIDNLILPLVSLLAFQFSYLFIS